MYTSPPALGSSVIDKFKGLPWRKLGIAGGIGLGVMAGAKLLFGGSNYEGGEYPSMPARQPSHGLTASTRRKLGSAPTMGLVDRVLGGSRDGVHAEAARGHITAR